MPDPGDDGWVASCPSTLGWGLLLGGNIAEVLVVEEEGKSAENTQNAEATSVITHMAILSWYIQHKFLNIGRLATDIVTSSSDRPRNSPLPCT